VTILDTILETDRALDQLVKRLVEGNNEEEARADLLSIGQELVRSLGKPTAPAPAGERPDLKQQLDKANKVAEGWKARMNELLANEPTEEERQLLLLALAKLAIERPGWDAALNKLALKHDDGEDRAVMYDRFRETHKSVMTPEQWGDLLRACIGLRRALFGEDPESVVEREGSITLAQNAILAALPEEP